MMNRPMSRMAMLPTMQKTRMTPGSRAAKFFLRLKSWWTGDESRGAALRA